MNTFSKSTKFIEADKVECFNIESKTQVLDCLKQVIDPDLNLDIVSCNFVKDLFIDVNNGIVKFKLNLTTPACPMKSMFQEACKTKLKLLDWVEHVFISFSSIASVDANYVSKHSSIKNIILVSSCKGGVGKSTFAVNLAFLLSQMSAKVGLCDLDVYGPSLHTLIPHGNDPTDNIIKFRTLGEDKQLNLEVSQLSSGIKELMLPIIYNNVKLNSVGYILEEKQFLGFNGPLASSLALQLINGTFWGDLDYLILDMPPGTGDVHITVVENVPVSSCVIVTKNCLLAYADAIRSIEFFNNMNIPIIGIVNNMCFAFDSSNKYIENDLKINMLEVDTHKFDYLKLDIPYCREISCAKYVVNDNEVVFGFVNAFKNSKNPLFAKIKRFVEDLIRAQAVLSSKLPQPPKVEIGEDDDLIFIMEKDKHTIEKYKVKINALLELCNCEDFPIDCKNLSKHYKNYRSLVGIKKILEVTDYNITVEYDNNHICSITYHDLQIIKNINLQSKLCGIKNIDW